jgi:aminoglycoside phosphotransferase (APT) family kinase protein
MIEHPLDAFLSALDAQPAGAPWRAGHAWQVRVRTTPDADPSLLTVWDDPSRAARAQAACAPSLAGQLFAVPELIELGPGWRLTRDIPGQPLTRLLAAHSAASVAQLPFAAQLVEGVGRLLRKLHSVPAVAPFGPLTDTGWQTFSGYVAARLEAHASALNHLALGEQVRVSLLESLGDLRHELSAFHPRVPATLVHGALSAPFLWVDPSGAEIIGLTGFGHAASLPAEYDLAFFMWMEAIADDDALVRSLYRGYGAARTMDVQRRERFFRRLCAFEVLVGDLRGVSARSEQELIKLAGPGA